MACLDCKDIETIDTLYKTALATAAKTGDALWKEDLQQMLDMFGLSNKERGIALVELYKVQAAQARQEVSGLVSLELERYKLKMGFELQLKQIKELESAIKVNEAKEQGYKDENLIQAMNAAGGLANYAINIDNVNAADRIKDLKKVMNEVGKRGGLANDIFTI